MTAATLVRDFGLSNFAVSGWVMPPADSTKKENARIGLALRQARKKAWGGYGSLARTADVAGVSQGLLSMIERGEHALSKVRTENLQRFPEAYGMSAREFSQLTGLSVVVPTEEESVSVVDNIHQVPIRNMACAGPALYSEEAVLGMAYVDDRLFRSDMMVVLVNGDSMSPTIQSGDEVYIDTRQLEPSENKIFLVHIPGDGYVLKRAMRVAGHWMLVSDNRAYAPLSPDEAHIIGRAYHHKPQGSDL